MAGLETKLEKWVGLGYGVLDLDLTIQLNQAPPYSFGQT